MNGELIKEFLVGLNFGVDDSSLSKFTKAIGDASVKVAALYASVSAAATGIFYSIAKISEGFEDMGYQMRIIAPAINKAIVLRQALLAAYSAAGINLTQAIQQSVLFNFSLEKTKYALEAIYKSVAVKFFPLITQQMDIFRQRLYANLPKIQAFLNGAIINIFRVFNALIILGERAWGILGHVFDAFAKLDEVTGGWSTKILGALAAWKLLNLGFLATPLGMIIGGIVALIALYDDFKVWQEGGTSLINWGSATVQILTTMIGVIGALAGSIFAITTATKAWAYAEGILNGVLFLYNMVAKAGGLATLALNLAMRANPIGLLITGFAALVGILVAIIAHWKEIKELASKGISFVGDAAHELFTGGQSAQSAYFNRANFASQPLISPGALNNNGITNNVQAQTQINVQGSADASATGAAVANQQTRVNADMTRNLKGPTR